MLGFWKQGQEGPEFGSSLLPHPCNLRKFVAQLDLNPAKIYDRARAPVWIPIYGSDPYPLIPGWLAIQFSPSINLIVSPLTSANEKDNSSLDTGRVIPMAVRIKLGWSLVWAISASWMAIHVFGELIHGELSSPVWSAFLVASCIFFSFDAFRMLAWELFHPALTLDSEVFRWRVKEKWEYTELKLSDVEDCHMDYGNELCLALCSGVEKAFDLNQIPEADRSALMVALIQAVGKPYNHARE